MGIVVTVISPEVDCIACSQTKRRFNALEVPFESITADDQMISELKSEGFSAFPIVRVDTGQEKYSWSGYRLESIKKLSELI